MANIKFHSVSKEFLEILTPDAVAFVTELERKFGGTIGTLLDRRRELQEDLLAGKSLNFLPETENIRNGDWKVAPIPKDLQDRRVEITGPAERKMVINALNSAAKVFMADLEDSLSPRWEQIIQGQINLRDAVDGTISFTSLDGKEYKLNDKPAVLIVRPRGLHLVEKHALLDGKPIHGSLLDFGLYFFHNAKKLIEKGSAPYFYLPKIEHYLEAKLWNDIFVYAQETLDFPIGTIKATVLIETITAAFQMDEILYELKDHIVAQNAGRWDYIFSYIKKHSHDVAFVCPDRSQIVMTQSFLKSYSQLLIKTCHHRGALAMGGMAAFIPIKNDDVANDEAIANVKKDKEREALDGHDGTWVAHPALIPIAMEVFNRLMPEPNQIYNFRDDVNVTAEDLLEVPLGTITEAGLRNNISVGLQYIASWLDGNGCVPIFNLMEDAATAEIARTQIWQWIKHKASLDDGTIVTKELFLQLKEEEEAKISHPKLEQASKLLEELVLQDEMTEFLTLKAYDCI